MYYVRVEAEGFPAQDFGPVNATTDEVTDLDIELVKGGEMVGQLLLPEGARPTQMVVGVGRGDGYVHTAVLGVSGRYKFPNLAPGTWQIGLVQPNVNYLAESTYTREPTYVNRKPYAGKGDHPAHWHFEIETGETTEYDLDLTRPQCRIQGELDFPAETIDRIVATVWQSGLRMYELNFDPLPAIGSADDPGFIAQIETSSRQFELSWPWPADINLRLDVFGAQGEHLILEEHLPLFAGTLGWSFKRELTTVSGNLTLNSEHDPAQSRVFFQHVSDVHPSIFDPNVPRSTNFLAWSLPGGTDSIRMDSAASFFVTRRSATRLILYKLTIFPDEEGFFFSDLLTPGQLGVEIQGKDMAVPPPKTVWVKPGEELDLDLDYEELWKNAPSVQR